MFSMFFEAFKYSIKWKRWCYEGRGVTSVMCFYVSESALPVPLIPSYGKD